MASLAATMMVTGVLLLQQTMAVEIPIGECLLFAERLFTGVVPSGRREWVRGSNISESRGHFHGLQQRRLT